MPEEKKVKSIESLLNLPYVVLSPMGQEKADDQKNHFLLIGPMSRQEMVIMGMVKDSSIT